MVDRSSYLSPFHFQLLLRDSQQSVDSVLLVQVVLLGSAPDPRIQQEFVDLANQLHNMHHDRARFCLNYDEPLSHLVFDHIT